MRAFALALALLAAPAAAQQAQPHDVATLQRIIMQLREQRSVAFDAAAVAEAKLAASNEELAKLKAELDKAQAPAASKEKPKD
jgi:hypothetical protein